MTDANGAKTEHHFYRGMNGDYTSSGTTYITLSDGATRVDENWLRGQAVEQRQLKSDNTPLTRSVTWLKSALTAGSGASGAYFVAPEKQEETTYGTTNQTTRTEYQYDSYGNVTRQVEYGDLATTTDDRNTERSYLYNTTAYIVDQPQWEKRWPGTGGQVCTTYTSSDVPKTIPASGTPTVYSTLDVPDSGLLTDVNVLGLNGTHTYIDDLIFTLISPSGAQTILMNRACTSQDNFNLSFDDESPNAPGSWPCPPTNGGTYRPDGNLATFDGSQMHGTWTLQVQDVYTNDGGSLNGWRLELCRPDPAAGPGSELAFTEYAYDGQATPAPAAALTGAGAGVGAVPAHGHQTLVRQYAQVTPGAVSYDTTTAYDAWGRPVSVTDPNSHTSATGYHSFYGYTQAVTNTLGHVTSYVVDPGWGVQTSVTDPNDHTTTLEYDGYGRLVRVWQPTEPANGPASAEFVYDAAARPAYVESRQLTEAAAASYLEGWAYYDGFGRELQSQGPAGEAGQRILASQQYDALGQLLAESSAYQIPGVAGSGYVTPTWTSLANYHYYVYDELGRTVRSETRSHGNILFTERTTYDGWQQSSYDANDHRRDAWQDAFGQTVRVVEHNTGDVTYTTVYTYSLAGHLTQVQDAAGNLMTMSYDLLGRKTAMSDPDMGSWQYGYDGAGNLTSQQDGRHQWLYLAYDGLNRLVHKRQDSPSGPLLAEYVYDASGQRGLLSASRAFSAEGTTEVRSVAYDARDRLLQQAWTVPGSGGGTFRLDYTYNAAGQQASLRYPGGNGGEQGELVTYRYNSLGQLDQVIGEDGTQYVASTQYNAQGQVTAQRLDVAPSGLTRQSVYNPDTLRLETLQAGTASPYEDLQKLSYTYDLAGNVTTLTDQANAGQVQSFGYDGLDRLVSASTSITGTGQYSHTYGYDALGNLTSYNGNSYTYGNQPHAVTAAFGNVYGYDAVGNQITRTIAGLTYTQAFDDQGRLLSLQEGVTLTARFLYDADGQRVMGTVDGVTTVYIGGRYEYQAGAVTQYYEGGAIRRTGYAGDNGLFYSLVDHLRSTSVLVNQDGTVAGRNGYYPYGGNRGGTLSGLTTKRFTGQYHEQDWPGGEGLYYYNARWYDAQLGRFLSADTIVPDVLNPQSLNRYSYVLGNALRYIDPSGHDVGCAGRDASACGASSYRPSLKSNQLKSVKSYSAQYKVPWQVTAGVLTAEIRLDTQWRDYVETAVVHYVPQIVNAYKLPVVGRLASRNPGPGIGNIHIATAKTVSSYFAREYPAAKEMQLGYHEVDNAAVAYQLTLTEQNIRTVAAYVRQLADYRFGSQSQPQKEDHSDLSKWTVTDAAAIWHAYRYGVPDVSPEGAQGFDRLKDFQDRGDDVDAMLEFGTFRGAGAEQSIRDSRETLMYYFGQ